MKKLVLLVLVFLLLMPTIMAEEHEEVIKCGITNLASCLPAKFFQFVERIINAPVEPLLNLVKSLLSEPVNIQLFQGLWAVMLYIISMFYGLLFMWSGFQFMVSGYDVARREKAKLWLKNTVLMIVLVQASYYIYALLLEISSVMTAGVIGMIDSSFFLLTVDNVPNVGLQLVFAIPYVLTLLSTALILIVRYVIISVGVVFFPLAIFCYFIDPLQGYGKLIMSFIFSNMFVGFFASIVLLAFSMVIGISIFEYVKILVMLASFLSVNLLIFLLCWFSIVKSAVKTGTKIVTKL